MPQFLPKRGQNGLMVILDFEQLPSYYSFPDRIEYKRANNFRKMVVVSTIIEILPYNIFFDAVFFFRLLKDGSAYQNTLFLAGTNTIS
jgi:hypothetical protein